MGNRLLHIITKLALLSCLVAVLLFPFARIIHDQKEKHEPRSSLLYRRDIGEYRFALAGDSVFNSRYVDSDSEAIWNRFSSCTGVKCFPGSLYAATLDDMVYAARYLSLKMPAGSTVFIDIMPLKFLGADARGNDLFASQLSDRLLEEKYPPYKIYNYLKLDYLKYLGDRMRGDTSELNRTVYHNRTWNVDGDPVEMKHFRELFVSLYRNAALSDMGALERIGSTLKGKGIEPVFVLTPINRKMIESSPDQAQAERIYRKVELARGETRKQLEKMQARYIDLFDQVPDRCFSDLVHTNACGDEIVAKALADYVRNSESKQAMLLTAPSRSLPLTE